MVVVVVVAIVANVVERFDKIDDGGRDVMVGGDRCGGAGDAGGGDHDGPPVTWRCRRRGIRDTTAWSPVDGPSGSGVGAGGRLRADRPGRLPLASAVASAVSSRGLTVPRAVPFEAACGATTARRGRGVASAEGKPTGAK